MVHVLIGMEKHILWNLEVYPFPLKKAATQSTVPPSPFLMARPLRKFIFLRLPLQNLLLTLFERFFSS